MYEQGSTTGMSELGHSMNLQGNVAIVTGGSRGIGRAVVERLAQSGVHVIINYLQDEEAALSTSKVATQHGTEALVVRADIRRVDAAEEVVRAAILRFGRIDFMICNAGIWKGAPVEILSEELWDQTIDVNLKGTWTMCRAAVPEMKKRRRGRIVIVSSTAGQRGEANVSNYAASKGGQISFAKSLASELAPFGITVNSVAPGWVDTEMNLEVFGDANFRRSVEQSIPLGRIATADDVAYPILFLCSEWARHITGEVLNVNGGSVLCG